MPVFQADEAVEIAFDAAGLSVFTSANLQALGEDIDAELASYGTMRFENAADYLTTAAAAVTYQPIDSDLTALAGLTGTNTIYYRSGVATWSPVTVGSGLSFSGGTLATSGVLLTANNLSELTATASTARANLGLGTMAVETAANYLTVAAAAAGYQPLDGDLSALAALSGTNTIYYRSAANTWSAVTVGTGLSFSGGTLATSGGGGGTPGGSNTQIQYNNSGAFAGSSSLTFNSTLGQVAVPSISLTGNISSPAWTTNGIGIAHTTRTLTDTTSAGTVAASYTSVLGGNTIAANSATTFTDYASLWLGTPTAGTNVTITNPYSLVTAGAARFGGQVTVAQGTLTSSAPLTLTQTWNNAAVAFTAFDLNITATAQDVSSNAMTLRQGSTNLVLVRAGSLDTNTSGNSILQVCHPTSYGGHAVLGWRNQYQNGAGVCGDIFNSTSPSTLPSVVAGVVASSRVSTVPSFVITDGTNMARYWVEADNSATQRNSTSAQTFNVSNTYTSATNFEYGRFQWNTNEFRIGTAVGSAGGTQRALVLGSWTTAGVWTPRLVITPGSTGAFYLGAVADSTTTGGNARGVRAIDFQVVRYNANQVASGDYSLILQGQNNRVANGYNWGTIVNAVGSTVTGASGLIVSGSTCTASNVYSVVVNGNNQISSGQQSFIGNGGYLTASGTYSFIGNGDSSTASANYAFIGIGQTCTASAQYTDIVSGLHTVADRYGMSAKAVGRFSANGDAQSAKFILRIKTTDATATTMMLDGSTTRLTIPSGKMMLADVWISGIKSDGSAAATYRRKVAIKNVGGTTSLVGTVDTIGTDCEDNAATDVAITADDTNDALQINVTGIASETWRWVAVVEGVEVAYGT